MNPDLSPFGLFSEFHDMLNEPGYVNTFCPVCKHSQHDLHHAMNGYGIVKCRQCDFVFVKDVPSDEFLCAHYRQGYTADSGEYVPKLRASRRWKYWAFSQLLRYFGRRRKTIQLLEIGCHQGDLLEIVKDDPKFDAIGLDLAEKPLEYAQSRGLNVHLSDLETMNFASDSFDFVVALHVLEHVQNPERLVSQIQRVLRPGGYFIAVMPCVSHIKARLAGPRWHYWAPPSHLWYFSPSTLSKFVERLGLTPVHASCFYHRAHVRLFARKETRQHSHLPRWMATSCELATPTSDAGRPQRKAA